MLGLRLGSSLLKGMAAILCISGIAWLALAYFIPAPPSKFTIATGAKNQTYEAVGKRYQDILARSGVGVELRVTNGAGDNIKLLDDPASGIKVGIAQGGISDSNRSPDLLSLGRINYQIYWLFQRAAEASDDLRQLKGKRIAVGPEGSGQRATTEKILGASGVNYDNTTLLNLTTQAAATALDDGRIDALFLPIALDAAILQSLLENRRLRPMNFTEGETLVRIFPFLVRLVLPRAVIDFQRILPATDIALLAAPNIVLVRKDIHPELVALLARTIVEAHGRPGIVQHAGEFPTLIDPEYPMAQIATDFYKNGPSFLSRYLPFWMLSYAQRSVAVLVIVFAIGLPLFNYVPRLYLWFLRGKMGRIYRRLRAVEKSMQSELTVAQAEGLRGDLESIDQAATTLSVPMRQSALLFALKTHINLTRTRLASRLVEIRSQAAKAA